MPHKKGHTKITKSDMMNKKILDKMNPEMIMKYLLKFGLIDPKKDFKYGGSVQKKAPVKSVTYKKGGVVKARDGVLVNRQTDKKIDRGLRLAALKKNSDLAKSSLKKLQSKNLAKKKPTSSNKSTPTKKGRLGRKR